MASASTYTIVHATSEDVDELESTLTELILEHIKEEKLDEKRDRPAEELVEWTLKRRRGKLALTDFPREIPQKEIIEELCRKHSEQIDGVIRVGAEDTRGSMNARMYEVTKSGELEIDNRERRDSFPIGGHPFSYRGVVAINPEL